MLIPFDRTSSIHQNALVELWNAACGASLALTARAIKYNTTPAKGEVQFGSIAKRDGQPAGFVLASVFRGDPKLLSHEVGWIDAIAVHPSCQRQGLGAELLNQAEGWLTEQGCIRVRLGGSLHPFAPGLPDELATEDFFSGRGYFPRAGSADEWDVARGKDNPVQVPAFVETNGTSAVRPARIKDIQSMRELFAREFPGRWQFEFEEFLREGGRMSDYLVHDGLDSIDGFARLTFEDSERPIERFFMNGLARPWGQLGPIGVSKHQRGKGYARAMLEYGLTYLQDQGAQSFLIDWTSLLALYGKFGFKPYRKYRILVKSLES